MSVSNLENAFLVLLGQVALICSGVFFGIPYYIVSGGVSVSTVSINAILLAIFIGGSSLLMLVNIVLGWSSLRHCIKDAKNYNEKMFVVDVAVTVIFFFMNNVLLITLGVGSTDIELSELTQFESEEVASYSLSFGLASMLLLSVCYFGTNKMWNKLYYLHKEISVNEKYERFTNLCILLMAMSFVYICFSFQSNLAQIAALIVFFVSWISIDLYWVFSGFFSAASDVDSERSSVESDDESKVCSGLSPRASGIESKEDGDRHA